MLTTNQDLLNIISVFNDVKNIEYTYVLGRKNKNISISIKVTEHEFKHLFGIHKLSDIEIPVKSESILLQIMNNDLSLEKLMTSRYFMNITTRIDHLIHLKNILENPDKVTAYSLKKNPNYSHIKADYLLKFNHTHDSDYLFARKNSIGLYTTVSFFNDSTDYSSGQTMYHVMQITKDGEEIFRHDKYNEQIPLS